MMIAMMLPSVLPQTARHGVLFGSGYVLVWAGFGAVAAFAQCELDRAGLLAETMALRSVPLAALVVVGGWTLSVHAAKTHVSGALPHARWRQYAMPAVMQTS